MKMPHRIAIVSDCGGQAMERMALRVYLLFAHAVVTRFVCDSLAGAAGNIGDAIDAGANVILCNSAPRAAARQQNGDAIVFGQLNGVWIVSTLAALALLRKFAPDFKVREIDISSFMKRYGNTSRTRFNFRGLEVVPLIAYKLCEGENLSRFSKPVKILPRLADCVWLVDEIEQRFTNLKLSILRSEAPWYKPGKKVSVKLAGRRAVQIRCYERLTDIPPGKLGIYEGSSGLGDKRFLEIAVMGGQAARKLRVQRSGILIKFEE